MKGSAVIHYQYARPGTPKYPTRADYYRKLYHWARYVTRSTHLNNDHTFSDTLYGYRNTSHLQASHRKTLTPPQIAEIKAAIFEQENERPPTLAERRAIEKKTALINGRDPFTGEKIHWHKFKPKRTALIDWENLVDYIAGDIFVFWKKVDPIPT